MLLRFVSDASFGFPSINYKIGVIHEDFFVPLMSDCACGIAEVESHSLLIHCVKEYFVSKVPRCGGTTASLSCAKVFMISC